MFFPAVVVSILLYGSTIRTLSKRKSKTGIAQECNELYFKKSWKQHPTIQELYGYLAPIYEAIQIRLTRHAGHCRRSKDELLGHVFQWTPSHGRASVKRLTRTYLQKLCTDTGCSLEDLTEAIDDKDEWWQRESVCVREISTNSMTMIIYIYMYIYIYIVMGTYPTIHQKWTR